ncbi:MAG: signal recognition particle-docking protein FtsY [Treponema sp.]|jgi:fused signal recognition particle receptor|nr:signal recognition particle-docking protein FtsY [Treponema sp.]
MNFKGKIKSFFTRNNAVSQDMYDDLCDLLVEGDFGASQAYKIIESLKKKCNEINEFPAVFSALLTEELLKAPQKDIKPESGITVILLLGVNGTGKTTSAAKLALYYRTQYNRKPVLAAADTFRAAAIDQLKIHGEALSVRVVAHKDGGDPAAVVYDAVDSALSGGADIVIADTAGRMHTKTALVDELKKIDRVVLSKALNVRYMKLLVLDATTGRNAVAQAEIFNEAVAIDGVILTKYDSSAKGGVVFSLASELRLPVVFICGGEKYTDIEVFDPVKYVKEFTGIA